MKLGAYSFNREDNGVRGPDIDGLKMEYLQLAIKVGEAGTLFDNVNSFNGELPKSSSIGTTDATLILHKYNPSGQYIGYSDLEGIDSFSMTVSPVPASNP